MYVIDILSFTQAAGEISQKLDKVLEEIFSKCLVIGYDFQMDLKMFKMVDLHFYKSCNNYIDVQALCNDQIAFKFAEAHPPSLKNVCERLFSKQLCKNETCSNWQNRPLRKSQLHYAAMDAFILIKIHEHMTKEYQQLKMEDYIKPLQKKNTIWYL